MNWPVEISARAAKSIRRLDRVLQERIVRRIEELALDPFDPRFSKQLQGSPVRSSRVADDWRILFEADADPRLLRVLAVRPRGSVYRRLR